MSRRAAPEAVVGGGGAPLEVGIGGVLYDRVGIDEDGRAYYAAESETGFYVAERDPDGTAAKTVHVPHARLKHLLEQVEERTGWRETDQSWLDRADRLAGGVEA